MVKAIAQHIRMRLKDDRVIAPAATARRTVARVVLEQARDDGLLAFGLADTHLHALAVCAAEAAAQLARRIAISLGRRLELGVGFTPVHLEPIRDGRHLLNAFRYDLRQARRHGLEWDALAEATSLPDLLGLRLVGSYTAGNVRRALPRLQRSELLDLLGVTALEPCDGPVERLRAATLAAACLPDLKGGGAEALDAKRALVAVAGPRVPAEDLARELGVSRRTLFYLRSRPAEPRLVLAVRLQLGLMARRADRRADEPQHFAVGEAERFAAGAAQRFAAGAAQRFAAGEAERFASAGAQR